jgi:hypothetical protein
MIKIQHKRKTQSIMVVIAIRNVFFLIFKKFDTFILNVLEIEFNVLFHLVLYRSIDIKNKF